MTGTPTWLFDLDGTLVDSRAPILRSLNHAFGVWDLPLLGEGDLDHFVGPPLQATLAGVLSDQGRDAAGAVDLLAEFRSDYRHASIELALAYDGIPEMLEHLAETHRLSVVTSKTTLYAVPILETLGLARFFARIDGPDPAIPEPKSVTMTRALDALGSDPRRDAVAMVGDRRHDIEAAADHRIQGIGVTWGFGDHTELASAGATHIVDTPHDLIALSHEM